MEHYAGPDSRRAQEHADSMMMPSGQGDFANLPQGVVMKYYPRVGGAHYNLDDTIRGVDHQMKRDMDGHHRSGYEDGQQ
jgi:hypothetical protein